MVCISLSNLHSSFTPSSSSSSSPNHVYLYLPIPYLRFLRSPTYIHSPIHTPTPTYPPSFISNPSPASCLECLIPNDPLLLTLVPLVPLVPLSSLFLNPSQSLYYTQQSPPSILSSSTSHRESSTLKHINIRTEHCYTVVRLLLYWFMHTTSPNTSHTRIHA